MGEGEVLPCLLAWLVYTIASSIYLLALLVRLLAWLVEGGFLVPPRGYRVVSLRGPVYERLRRYAEERGFTSLSDAVQSLLDAAEASQILRALEDRLSRIEALEAVERANAEGVEPGEAEGYLRELAE